MPFNRLHESFIFRFPFAYKIIFRKGKQPQMGSFRNFVNDLLFTVNIEL